MNNKQIFIEIIEDLHAILNNDSTEVAKWLDTPNMALDNRSAMYWISKGRIDIIENLLDEIENGFIL